MSITTIIPRDMDFFSDIERLGGVERCVDVYENAQQQAVSGGQTMHFFFSQCDAADFRDSFVRFSLQGNLNGTGTVGAFQQGISCIFNRVRLLAGSDILIDILDFNLLYQNWIISNDINSVSSTLNIQMATSDNLATRQGNFTNNNKIYTVYLGWVATLLDKVIPVSALSKQLHLELILETPVNCITSDAVNPTYTVLSPQYHYKQITFTSAYKQMLADKMARGGISLLYLNYSNYTIQVPASTTNISNTLPWKYTRMIGFNCIARNATNISSLAQDNKFSNYANSTIFVSGRVRVNNLYYPADAVNGNTEAFDQYLEFHDLKYNDNCLAATAWTADPGYFELDMNVNQHPKHLNANDWQIQGVDTSQSSSTIVHEVKFSSPGTATAQQWDYYVQFFSTMNINSSGNVNYQE